MTIYDIPNIEHCDVTTIGTNGYRIFAHEGWYIRMTDDEPFIDENGNTKIIYKTVAIQRVDGDFSTVEITAEADLPENAQILGNTDKGHKVM